MDRRDRPTPTGSSTSALSSVSCPAATNCIAVGTSGIGQPPLAEQWNGSTWTLETTLWHRRPDRRVLPDDQFLHRGGRHRRDPRRAVERLRLDAPERTHLGGANGSYLSSISCTSATDCVAVGYYNNSSGGATTLAEQWNGTAWTIMNTPNPAGSVGSYLSGVSCATGAACTAVGYYQKTSNIDVTLTEGYSG